MTAEEIQTVFNKAADLLERDGWCQGKFWYWHGGPSCIVGAVSAMHKLGTWDGEQIGCELRRRVGTPHVTNWNDEPGRTVEEVLAVLRGT